MQKLRKLRVCGFRGIRNDIEIDFGKKRRSTIIIGDNGTGKSSFVDAVEWLLTGRIEHLAREGCGDLAYRHRLLPDDQLARVEIVTSDQHLSGSRTLDSKRRAEFDPEGGPLIQFIDQARGDTVILRYGQMRDFVDKTKTEKLRYLADILGMGTLSQLRDELLKTLNKLRRDEDYRYLLSQIEEYKNRLSHAVAPNKFNEANVIALAESLRQKLGGQTPVADMRSLQASTDELLARSRRDERAREIMTLRQHLSDLQPVLDDEAVVQRIGKLACDTAALRTDKATVDQIALAELYEAGQEVIERQIGDTRICPLCGQKVNRQDLMDHLCAQLEAIGEIRARLNKLDLVRQRLVGILGDWKDWLTTIRTVAANLSLVEGEKLKRATEPALEVVGNWEDGAKSKGDSLRPVPTPSPEEHDVLRTLARVHAEAVAAIERRLRELEGGAEQKTYYDQLEQLDRLARDFVAWNRACRRKRHFERQIETMESVQTLCERMEHEALEQVLEAVSADVNRYYLRLHSGEGFDQIRLWPTEARGVEFEFTFHGERISPPGQLMSESHLNTLGVCLFLASARHFNQHTRFLILDDIINSVDAGHRSPLARLLRDEFKDFQLILLTHDRMWFDILRRTAPGWMTLEIGGWLYEEGLWFKDRPGDLEDEARQYLQQRDITAAGNKARQWLERVLKERCFDLQVPVPFRYNDRNEERMPGELLPAFRKHIEQTQIYMDNATLFQDLEASQFIGSRLSHNNVYPSGPPQLPDVELFLQDIRRLDSLVLCPNCNTHIAAKHTPASARRKRCRCGSLELR